MRAAGSPVKIIEFKLLIQDNILCVDVIEFWSFTCYIEEAKKSSTAKNDVLIDAFYLLMPCIQRFSSAKGQKAPLANFTASSLSTGLHVVLQCGRREINCGKFSKVKFDYPF